ALETIVQAIEKAGDEPGNDIVLAMDVASSEFFDDGQYNLAGEGVVRTSVEMVSRYEEIVEEYPIISIEDGLDENDWEDHKLLTYRLEDHVQLVVDDLYV